MYRNQLKKNKMANQITKFEEGNIYEMRFIGDSELKPQFICIKRTAKTVIFERYKGAEIIKRRIKIYDNCEYILDGSYSMAPSIRANRIAG